MIKKHIINLLDKGKRLDGRKLLEFRKPITIEYDIAKTAEGSAQVTIGETIVQAGVKMSIEKPYPDQPDQGSIMVGVELLPMSNPNFESGPPSIQAIELGRVVDRGIRESKSIDFKKLCVEPGEKVWFISIDICPINDAGNLFDASALAAYAALTDATFPEFKDGLISYKKKTKNKLPLINEPIACTVWKIGKHLIVDTLPDEEASFDARLTVAINKDGNVCALQKNGDTPLKVEDIDKMVEIALEKTKELRKVLK